MKSQAIVFTGIQKVELLEMELPVPEKGEALVQTLYSLISPGTELRCLAGKEFSEFPFIAGYAAVGRIVETGVECPFPMGQLVFFGGTQKSNLPRGWGGHCQHAVVSAGSLIPLPPGIELLEAVTIALASISYHGTKVSRPQPDEKVAVVGLGPIGYLSALCHALSGAKVVGVDTEAWRVEHLQAAGIQAALSRGSILSAVEESLGQRADLVVDATGAPAVLPQCIEAVKLLDWGWNEDTDHGARILIQGSYPADVSIPYRESFVRELKFLFPRNYNRRDLDEVLHLIQTGKLKTKGLIGDVVMPKHAREGYRRLQEREKGLLTVAFKWSD
jgi:2-desacetyl-2-hydroxyethyl bacteriochlorophyllide A dehydrogenase